MSTPQEHAISPTREEDYPEWYQQVVKVADLAENSPVRGCMVIKPWGYGIWENIQKQLDDRIKRTGHENAYFPLFIPLSFFEREAAHVEGFAKECAVVTHHRLEAKDGKLIPAGPLEEPLVIRPTSETIIGEAFSRWVQSYRDLPMLINQWANIVRWEMRPRVFLRTMEFLWQEGHTAHASEAEAREETLKMLEVYRSFAEEVLAMPTLVGEKSPGERFPGAVNTYCMEAMMQDRKALQAGTTHYLGQNFAKVFRIAFSGQDGRIDHAYTTSWGVSTRLIGGLIMMHSDDDGLRLPPRIAQKQVVLIPVASKGGMDASVLAYADQLAETLRQGRFYDRNIEVVVDKRDLRGGEKNWQWIKKGIPVRLEVGPRDLQQRGVMLCRRDRPHKERTFVREEELVPRVSSLLAEMQEGYLQEAKAFRERHLYDNIRTFDELRVFFTPKNPEKPEIHGGFVKAKWCGDPATEKLLEELKVTIRCLPLEQSGTEGHCVLTGRPATLDAVFAKSY